MPKPVTPLVGCDAFVLNAAGEVLLIQREDNGLWAMPGGSQDLGETPEECARRECWEETGFTVRCTRLLGVFSSKRYPYVHYPWKDNEFCHLLFAAEITGGQPKNSSETLDVRFFPPDRLPQLSDGHEPRIRFAFRAHRDPALPPHFE